VRSSIRHPNSSHVCTTVSKEGTMNLPRFISNICIWEGEGLEESWVRRGLEERERVWKRGSKGMVLISPLRAMLQR